MRRGFTLLELMTVAAIMAMLGFAAASGYQALVRGINERSAVASSTGLLRSAKERAEVDRVPTAVFCYNKLVRGASDEDNAVVVGVMTAVRRSGRLSFVQGKYLFDEFADLSRTYDASDDASDLDKSGGMKLYRFPAKSGGTMQYSIVSSTVYSGEINNEYASGLGALTNIVASAFYDLQSSNRAPSSWKVGDSYAFEMGELELPSGFIFGNSIPTDITQISTPKVLYFDPNETTDNEIEIWSTRPDSNGMPEKWNRIGKASSDEEKTT